MVSKERVRSSKLLAVLKLLSGTAISDKLQGFRSRQEPLLWLAPATWWWCAVLQAWASRKGQSCEETSPQDSRTDSAAAAASPSLSQHHTDTQHRGTL